MALVGNISGSNQFSSIIGISGSIIVANEPDSRFPILPGADVVFFVSGSSGSLGTTTRGVAAFGGDVRISGSLLVGTGSVTITSNDIQFGTPGLRLERAGDSLTFRSTNHFIFESSTTPGAADVMFTGSLQIGRSTLASGLYSHAKGYLTTASADYSHAEGYLTLASNLAAHAEGAASTASGLFSHAEGLSTVAEGERSHAEGISTYASANGSHAEGYLTTGSGQYAHAEGESTVALGQASHASGLGTIASGSYQTVMGKYNSRNDSTSLFIIGNGTGDSNINRSNALTISSTQINSNIPITGSIGVGHAIMGWYAGNTTTVTDSSPTTLDVRAHLINLVTQTTTHIYNLPDGMSPGQVLYFVLTDSTAGSARITPTSGFVHAGTYVNLPKDTGASAILIWVGNKWSFLAGRNATVV